MVCKDGNYFEVFYIAFGTNIRFGLAGFGYLRHLFLRYVSAMRMRLVTSSAAVQECRQLLLRLSLFLSVELASCLSVHALFC